MSVKKNVTEGVRSPIRIEGAKAERAREKGFLEQLQQEYPEKEQQEAEKVKAGRKKGTITGDDSP